MNEIKQPSAPLRGASGIGMLICFALAYFLCAEISRFLVFQIHPAAMFWLPSGLLVAALLLHEFRAWGLFVLTAGVANIGFHLLHGESFGVSCLFFGGDCIEALIGAWLVRRFVAQQPKLTMLRQMVGFVFFAAMLSPAIRATLGVVLHGGLMDGAALTRIWLLWWAGDAIGVLLTGSLVLVWPGSGVPIKEMSRWRRVEMCVIAVVMVAGTWFVIGAADHGAIIRPFLLIPCLIWAGLRFGLRAAVLASMTFTFAAGWYTSRGFGVFPSFAANSLDQILIVHLYAVTVALSCLLPASIMAERQEVETLLRQSEATARSLLETPGDLAFMIAADGTFLDGNRQFCALLGKPVEELMGISLWSILPPQKESLCRAVVRMVVEEKRPVRLEYEGITSWYDCSAYPILNERDEVEKMSVMAWDITERKRAEQALYQSEQRYRILIETMNEGVVRVDTTHKIEYVNRKFCEMADRAPAELIGTEFLELIAEDARERHAGILQERSRGVSSSFETVLQRKDGTRRDCILSGSPIFDQGGSFTGMLGIFTDITEHKRVEVECRHLAEELGQKNQELEDVLYAASHDLRSPVVNIQGFSKRVALACAEITRTLDESDLTSAVREKLAPVTKEEIPKALRFIQSSVTKMDGLISGLLRLSRVGKTALRPETLDMNQMIAQIVSTMAFQVQKAGAVVEVGTLPPVIGDAMLLNQVFSNLLDNALKYRDDQRPLRLCVTGRQENGDCIYCVEDNGLGIAADRQKKVWDLFWRLNPSVPGEGLGLNLVHRIVERHRGRVWVESDLGQGSRFFVALPSAEATSLGGTR